MPIGSQRRSLAGSRSGGVLIATLVLVMTIAGVAACLFQLDATRAKRQIASVDNKRAFNVAEAGLAEAYYGLTIGKSGVVGSPQEPASFGGGLFWVEATELGSDVVGLESTGMCGSGRASLSLVVRRNPSSIASLGVLGANEVVLGANASIEAYDSRGGAPPAGSLQVQSNVNITVGDGALIDGDAAPGPDGSVILGAGASVTGSTAPNALAIELPPIEVPAIASQGDVTQTALRPRVLGGEEQAYGVITVGAGSELVLQGPAQIVAERVTVSDQAKLTFDTTGGAITLYVTDWLNLLTGSVLSFSSQDPTQVTVLVSASGNIDRDGDGRNDPAARFLCTGPFYGTMYVPDARLNLPASFELYGTASSQRLALGAGAKVHFDVALDAVPGAVSGAVERISWRVIDIPVAVARSLDESPFEVLGVDEATLAKPVDAHLDVGYQIHIWYTDLSGASLSYRGPEAPFDWSQVRSVSKILRQPL